MILRIRPPRLSAPKVRVVRSPSPAGVILALLFYMFFVTLGVAFFTIFCWKVAVDLGAIPIFPFSRGFLSHRSSWLLLAALASLWEKGMNTFANLLKGRALKADELPTDVACEFAAASE